MNKTIKLIQPKKTKTLVTSNNEIAQFIKITIGVIALISLFYVITYYKTKTADVTPTDTTTTIQYEEILVGNMLNQKESEYYVLLTKESDTASTLYSAYKNAYIAKIVHLQTYTANLNSGFNKMFVATTSQLNGSNITDIKFSQSTLVYVKNNKINAYYEGKNAIIKYYTNLIK